jgi:hypothetical protein
MSVDDIKRHTFGDYRRAVAAIGDAVTGLDRELRAIARRADLFPAQRDELVRAAQAKAASATQSAREQLAGAVAADRLAGRYVDKPEGEALTRRLYYATAAASELSGMRPDVALTLITGIAKSGDHEKAREYLRAARPVLADTVHAVEAKRLEMAIAPVEQRMHSSFSAGIDAVERNLPFLDRHVAELTAQAGRMSDAERDGLVLEQPVDPRRLDLWLVRTQQEAGQAVQSRAAQQDSADAVAGPAGAAE